MFLSQWPFSDYCANTLIIDMLIKYTLKYSYTGVILMIQGKWKCECFHKNKYAKIQFKYSYKYKQKYLDQNTKEQSSLTVEVVIQELEQLVMLLSQVGEVDEKSEKTKKLVQPIRNKRILQVNMFLIVLMVDEW